jgi:hypothetical protein
MADVAVVWWSGIAVQDSMVAVGSSSSSDTNLVVAATTTVASRYCKQIMGGQAAMCRGSRLRLGS